MERKSGNLPKIKNCPFCGKRGTLIHIEGYLGRCGEYIVSCPTGDDACTGYSAGLNFESPMCPGFKYSYKRGQPGARATKEEAIKVWNERIP
jgi:hypothetical protein